MEALIVILVLIIGLGAFDLSSLRWGTDSRPTLSDDHAR